MEITINVEGNELERLVAAADYLGVDFEDFTTEALHDRIADTLREVEDRRWSQ